MGVWANIRGYLDSPWECNPSRARAGCHPSSSQVQQSLAYQSVEQKEQRSEGDKLSLQVDGNLAMYLPVLILNPYLGLVNATG